MSKTIAPMSKKMTPMSNCLQMIPNVSNQLGFHNIESKRASNGHCCNLETSQKWCEMDGMILKDIERVSKWK